MEVGEKCLGAIITFIFELIIRINRTRLKIVKLEMRLMKKSITMNKKKMQTQQKEMSKIKKTFFRGKKITLHTLRIRQILIYLEVILLKLVEWILRLLVYILEVMITTFMLEVILIVIAVLIGATFLLMADYIQKQQNKNGYWKKVCVSGEFTYTDEEYAMYSPQFSQKEKNTYQLMQSFMDAIDGKASGQPIRSEFKSMTTREKAITYIGVFAVENGLDIFGDGKGLESDKEVYKNLSKVNVNSAGYGVAGLSAGATLNGEVKDSYTEYTKEQQEKIRNYYKKYNPEPPPANYEALYIPYATHIMANAMESTKNGYFNRTISGTNKPYYPNGKQGIIDTVAQSLNMSAEQKTDFAKYVDVAFMMAQYHGAASEENRQEHLGYAQFVGEFYMQTNGFKDIKILADNNSESAFRQALLGENNYTRKAWSYNPNTNLRTPYFEINGKPITEPMLNYLHKNAINKEKFDSIIIALYNQIGSLSGGARDRILNFHYGISAYLLGNKVVKELEDKYALGQKCYWVWNECAEGTPTQSGYTAGGSYQVGQVATDAINVGTEPTGQVQGPWTGKYMEAAQNSPFKKYFGGYDTDSVEISKKYQASSKWGVPYEMQRPAQLRGKQTVRSSMGNSGCPYYGLSYMASGFTRKNINAIEMASVYTSMFGTFNFSVANGNALFKNFNIASMGYSGNAPAGDVAYFKQVLGVEIPKNALDKEGMRKFIDAVLTKNGMVMISFNNSPLVKGDDNKMYKMALTKHYIVLTEKLSNGSYRLNGYNGGKDTKRDFASFSWDNLYKNYVIPTNNNKVFAAIPKFKVNFSQGVLASGSPINPSSGGTAEIDCTPENSVAGGMEDYTNMPIGDGKVNFNGMSVEARNNMIFGQATTPKTLADVKNTPIYGKAFKQCLADGTLNNSTIQPTGSDKNTKAVYKCLKKHNVMTSISFKKYDGNGKTVNASQECHVAVAQSAKAVFDELYKQKVLLPQNGGYNWRNMNNRNKKNPPMSNHAFGVAIDLNPTWNPYFTGGFPKTQLYQPRGAYKPGNSPSSLSFGKDHPVPRTFAKYGWVWGARYTAGDSAIPDYMHFEVIDYKGISKKK